MTAASPLSPHQRDILDHGATETPGTSPWLDNKASGDYICVRCRNRLFSSRTKFESGSGWPSFWQPVDPQSVKQAQDDSVGLVRTEVCCGGCDGHLGHVFGDAPQTPTGMRYCLNGAVLDFVSAGSDSNNTDKGPKDAA